MPSILGANTLSSGYDVDNSCRFNGGSSDYLNRTNATPTNQFKWTFSFWVKLSDITDAQGSGNQMILSDFGSASNRGTIFFEADDTLTISDRVSNSFTFKYVTTRLFRDVSAWYHIVVNHDRTLASPATKVFVNGVQETSFGTSTDPSQNGTSYFNKGGQGSLVGKYGGGNEYYNGYLSEAVWIDGSVLDADQFGEFDSDSGIWKPIDVSGLTFGDNGFYLDFEDSSALGDDVSGNGNDFTVNNLTAIDQSTDTCTNNFATMNPLAYRLDSGVSLPTYSEGNTVVSYADDSGAGKSTMATIGFQNGKWYWEYKVGTANDTIFGGITRMDYDPNDNFAGRSCFYNKSGAFSVGTGTGGTSDGSYGNSYTTNDIIGVAFDCDNGVIWFSKNGTWQNSATISEIGAGTTTNSATTGITLNQFWSPFFEGADGGMSANFGSPAYAISSGNTDGNGYGSFEYAPPSGYYAICTKNLAQYG